MFLNLVSKIEMYFYFLAFIYIFDNVCYGLCFHTMLCNLYIVSDELGPLIDFLIELFILLKLSAMRYILISDNSSLSIMLSSTISLIFYFLRTTSNKSEKLISSFFIDCACIIITKCYYQVLLNLSCCNIIL